MEAPKDNSALAAVVCPSNGQKGRGSVPRVPGKNAIARIAQWRTLRAARPARVDCPLVVHLPRTVDIDQLAQLLAQKRPAPPCPGVAQMRGLLVLLYRIAAQILVADLGPASGALLAQPLLGRFNCSNPSALDTKWNLARPRLLWQPAASSITSR